MKQAVAAREEEVSHFQKLGPSLQEKIQFFVKGDGATRVCHGQLSEPLPSVLELASGSYACHNGKCLDVGTSIEALGFFSGCTVRLYSSGSVAFVEQFGVGLRETNATNVGSRALLAAVLPVALLTLIPKVWLVVCLKVFPVPRLLTRVWCMALWAVLLANVPKPLPHLGVDPLCPQSPLLVLALVMCGLMKVLLFTLLPLRLRSLLIRFSPLGLLLVALPLSLLVRLLIQWRISFVLWSSSVPSWTPPEIEALRSRLVPPPTPVPSEPVLISHRALAQELARQVQETRKVSDSTF